MLGCHMRFLLQRMHHQSAVEERPSPSTCSQPLKHHTSQPCCTCVITPHLMLIVLNLTPVIYDYAQSIEEVLVEAQLPAHIQQQDVQVKFGNSSLLLVVGQQRVIDGCLAGRILPQHSSWKIGGCWVIGFGGGGLSVSGEEEGGACGRAACGRSSMMCPQTLSGMASAHLPVWLSACAVPLLLCLQH